MADATNACAPVEQCWSRDNETFNCDSVDDLLDTYGDTLSAGDVVYVGEAHRPKAADLFRVDNVLDMIGEYAYEIGGDYAADFADSTPEAKAELEALIEGWIEKYLMPPRFYEVKNVREYVLTAFDFAGRQA
ncbi:hypothetical protein B551_0222585 [Cupriavidus sp. HPC(L)]|uniref:hypothetical protein n=1 Tax=Cupriavidus sp. HPC(L) TaxID=1217418 RepID=UPI00029130B0|nr:hypothetical protein [Cupriavidus sp. HPC(L)]ESH90761.1 hypothetical protein B551_0222585 [Cupriavidus sp. HPC(L)]